MLLHGIILTIGGIPLFYLGDEIGTLNDYGYRADPSKMHDSRWVHRPAANAERQAQRHDETAIEGRVYEGLRQLIQLRQTHPIFSGQMIQMIDTNSPHVLGYVRFHESQRLLVLANFSDHEQQLDMNLLRLYGLSYKFRDLLRGQAVPFDHLRLEPYQLVCLQPE